MDMHENARTTHHRRMLIVQRLANDWSVSEVAAAQGVTPKTVRKWRERFAAEGVAGLLDRSSRPHRSPARLDSTAEDAIQALRSQCLSGPAIARRLGRPISTIGQHITHNPTGQSNSLAAGKGLGWEYLHVAIDDRSRLACIQLLPSERQEDAIASLESSLAWFKQHGVSVERVMTDNGSAYRSRLFAAALKQNGVAHKRNRLQRSADRR